MNRQVSWVVGAALAWGMGSGCQTCRQPCGQAPCAQGTSASAYPPRLGLGILRPHPLTPVAAVPVAPAPPVLVTAPPPPAALAVPQPVAPAPPGPGFSAPPPPVAPVPGVPPVPAPEVRGYSPPPSAPEDAAWHAPLHESVRLAPPTLNIAESPRQDSAEPPPAAPTQEPPRPAVTEERSQSMTPSLPVGIPQFAPVRNGVSSGLKPNLDGLEWLRANRYRALLHVKLPGEDDAADRKLIEKNGFLYLTVEVAPTALTRDVVERFNRIVADPANQSLFVYDRNGMLAGGLWYLHFRTIDQASDEAARSRARHLGLKEDQNGEHRAMWLAIQKFLTESGK